MQSRTVTVRLADEDIEKLERIGKGNRTAGVRELLQAGSPILSAGDGPRARMADPAEASPDSGDFAAYGIVPAEVAPESEAMGRLERYMALAQSGIKLDSDRLLTLSPNVAENILTAAIDKEPKRSGGTGGGDTIDPTILAMMQIAEFYVFSEGDLWQTILVPLEVGFQDFDFPTGDTGAKREARQYLEDELQMHQRIEEIWLARRTYGNCYPIEFYADSYQPNKPPDEIIIPNPKHIAIGQQNGLGTRPFYFSPPAEAMDAFLSFLDLPSFVYSDITAEFNEKRTGIQGLPLVPELVTHFHEPKFAHQLYGIPPLALATRAIDSRRFLEEMRRATIEGVKNQLWAFLLENPRPGEMAALNAKLSGSRGARTGYLLWSSNLDIKVFVPESIDALLATETYRQFTLDIFRRLGTSIRLVAGESPDDTSRSDSTVDVDVFLSRQVYSRKPFQRYLQYLANKVVGLTPSGECKAVVRMADVDMQIKNRIKDQLAPLMNFGLPSPSTAFSMAGLDPQQEMMQHEHDFEMRKKYIMPYSGFAQDGPTGRATSTEPGRPAGKTESKPREKMSASLASDYSDSIEAAWLELEAAVADPAESAEERRKRVLAFIAALSLANEMYRSPAYAEGYQRADGQHEMSTERMAWVVAWDADNLSRFRDDLLAAVGAGQDIAPYHRRARMYADVGYRMAFAAGLFQARIEQGYTHWKRVVNYTSASGPCAWCRADSRTMHPLSEAFIDHPSGQCSQVFLRFYRRPDVPGASVRIPDVRMD